jgi:hypothetical protein
MVLKRCLARPRCAAWGVDPRWKARAADPDRGGANAPDPGREPRVAVIASDRKENKNKNKNKIDRATVANRDGSA